MTPANGMVSNLQRDTIRNTLKDKVKQVYLKKTELKAAEGWKVKV